MAIEISQSYSKELMIWLGSIFLVIPTIFTAMRLAAKHVGPKGIALDDYFAVVAWIFNVACATCLLIAAVDGQLGQHQKVAPDGQPILDDPHFLVYEKTKFATNMLTILGLGFSKLSILAFYLQIFTVRIFERVAYVVIALVVAWTVSFFFSNLFTCVPVTALVEPFYGNKCLDAITMWLASVVSDVVLDFTILLMPVPMIATLHLRSSQKFMLCGIFLLGGGICAISIVRLLIYYQIAGQFALHYNDETYYTSPIFFWAVIEVGLACVCAALPTLRPLWQRVFPSRSRTSVRYEQGYSRRSSGLKLKSFSFSRTSASDSHNSRSEPSKHSADFSDDAHAQPASRMFRPLDSTYYANAYSEMGYPQGPTNDERSGGGQPPSRGWL